MRETKAGATTTTWHPDGCKVAILAPDALAAKAARERSRKHRGLKAPAPAPDAPAADPAREDARGA